MIEGDEFELFLLFVTLMRNWGFVLLLVQGMGIGLIGVVFLNCDSL